MEINEKTKAMLRELGIALDRALTQDSQVKSIIDRIKGCGYDIYLVVEANIALDPHGDHRAGELFLRAPEDQLDLEHHINFNTYDEDFLASLQIQAHDR